MTPRGPRVAAAIVMVLLLCGATLTSDVSHRSALRPVHDGDRMLVVLVIGSDIGPPYRDGDPRRGNADAVHLVATDTVARRVTVVDIPRDALVGGRKVNSHLVLGGPERLRAQLEDYTGITIDHWMLTSFRGFERVTEALGGIDVVAERRMRDDASKSDFEPGPQRVEGADALAFARDRHSLPDGDIGRSRHQGDLLIGAHRRVAAGDIGLPRLVRLAGMLARHTVTDLGPGELLRLTLLAARIDPADVRQDSLTGTLGFAGAASVVHLRPRGAFARIRAGQVGPRD